MLPIILFGRRVRRLARASQDRVADTGAYVDEAIHEIRTVQAYAHEPQDRRRVRCIASRRPLPQACGASASARC